MKQSKYDQFLASFEGKELLKKHSLDEVGIWKVRGADSNCDLGGSHYMPEIGQFEGKLRDIIVYAVDLSGFWSWGPGDITRVNKPIKINEQSNQKRIELQTRKGELEAMLKVINNQLKDLYD